MKLTKFYTLGLLAVCALCGCQQKKQESPEVLKLQAAADGGDAEAAFQLGKIYASGTNGEPADYEKARQYYLKAAGQGNAKAENNLANLYLHGLGVQEDGAEALKWMKKAAQDGSQLAQDNLGGMYSRGSGVAIDIKEAIKWYRMAADQGYLHAQERLGQIYFFGEGGLAEDKNEAAKWAAKAADQGSAWGENALGAMYEAGQGEPLDAQKAFQWYLRAAEKGYAKAEANVAKFYLNGAGGAPKDPPTAYMWLKLSDAQGEANATNLLREAGALLTKDDVLKGERLFKERTAHQPLAAAASPAATP